MTLSSVAPTVDENGITAPTLPELLAYLQDTYRGIYGANVYLAPDSQDGQFLAILASAINDVNATAVAVYNSFSPATAQKTGLSNVVKINGLRRISSTHSTVDLTLTGVAGTIINGGIVKDANGYKWALPSDVTLDTNGRAVSTATCQTIGAVVALPNTVTQIQTPTRGWQAATNATEASVGTNTEPDGALRERQSVSAALPSQAVLDGIIAGVANTVGVTRYRVYENDTSAADANGIPAHALAAVVEGGAASALAQAINVKKPPGTPTFGNTSATATDSAGIAKNINFSRPTQVTIKVDITLSALQGYLATIGDDIKQAIANAINGLQIGAVVYHGQLYGPANLDGATNSTAYNITALTLARSGGVQATSNVTLAYDEIAVCSPSDVTLTVN